MKKVEKKVLGPGALTLRWVPVTTPDGRTRMEMAWTAPQVLRKASAA
jgi:hypothetical protein